MTITQLPLPMNTTLREFPVIDKLLSDFHSHYSLVEYTNKKGQFQFILHDFLHVFNLKISLGAIRSYVEIRISRSSLQRSLYFEYVKYEAADLEQFLDKQITIQHTRKRTKIELKNKIDGANSNIEQEHIILTELNEIITELCNRFSCMY